MFKQQPTNKKALFGPFFNPTPKKKQNYSLLAISFQM
jgi:hypothetical protein